MPVEAERRRFNGSETTRSVTTHFASAVAGGSRVPDGLDWQSFAAADFPGRRRHDLEGLTALRRLQALARGGRAVSPLTSPAADRSGSRSGGLRSGRGRGR